MSINETTPAPVAGGQHCYCTETYIDGKHHAVPFTTRKVVLAELKKGDVIADGRGWETEYVVGLFKVIRINKKTITVIDCDETGRICEYGYIYPSGQRKSKLSIRRTYDVVNV
jgi:hypothetical protein